MGYRLAAGTCSHLFSFLFFWSWDSVGEGWLWLVLTAIWSTEDIWVCRVGGDGRRGSEWSGQHRMNSGLWGHGPFQNLRICGPILGSFLATCSDLFPFNTLHANTAVLASLSPSIIDSAHPPLSLPGKMGALLILSCLGFRISLYLLVIVSSRFSMSCIFPFFLTGVK